jgi:histidinol dehydrogenase
MTTDPSDERSARDPIREIGRWSSLDHEARRQLVERGLGQLYDDALRDGIVALIEDVRVRGDAAVVDALKRFDGCEVDPGALRIPQAEIDAAGVEVAPGVMTALADAIDHVRRFNEKLCEQGDWSFESDPGLIVGEKVTPVSSVGLFVPSGKGSFPSVLVQLAVPAIVAGVPQIVVVVPPLPGGGGDVDPAVLAVCSLLGLHDVFRANGPAGIAAMAFGTTTIPKVRMVVGPGSPAVTCAQVEVQRWGTVTTMVLGPTESMVIADETADVRLLAADLLNEAEHGADSASLLVTTSESLLAATQEEVARQLERLPDPRRGYAAAALGINGGAVLVDSLAEAAEVANAYAPEHLQVSVADTEEVLVLLVDAGEILIGQDTPFSAANYVLGCPASLPTSGFAKVSGGVTADTFRKRIGVARSDRRALRGIRDTVVALARHEGFPAHEAAVTARDE